MAYSKSAYINVLKGILDNIYDNEISTVVKNEMLEHIYTDVYGTYKPRTYNRRYDNKGLGDVNNISFKKIGEGEYLVQNITTANPITAQGVSMNSEGLLASIIETGEGYEYKFDFYDKPRPFISNTKQDLKNNKTIQTTLKQALKRYGIETV